MFNSLQMSDKIAAMTLQLEQMDQRSSSKETYEICENLETLSELAQCFQANLEENELKTRLTQTLSKRWERIRGTSMCYTQQPFNEVNQFCLEIAKILSPLPEEVYILPNKQGPYFLLMPSLKSSRSVSDNIHFYKLHEFVLSDTQEVFIPVQECLDNAKVSDTHVYQNIASKDDENSYPPLTEMEVKRLKSHSKLAFNYATAIDLLAREQKYGGGLGNNLRRLIPRLRAGGVNEAGEEYDAAEPANIGILKFSTYWNSLLASEQHNYCNRYPGLQNLIGRLLRPNDVNYTAARYCVELIADDLETLVARYHIKNSDLNAIQQQCNRQQDILVKIFSSDSAYPMNPSDQNSPRILSFIIKKYPSMLSHLFEKNEEVIDSLLRNKIASKENLNKSLQYALKIKDDELIYLLLLKIVTLSLEDQKELLSQVDTKNKGIYYGGILSYVTHQHPEFIQSMLAACPEERKSEFINQRDSDGSTPLRWAAAQGSVRAIDALCKSGADIHAVNEANANALDYAVYNGRNEAAKLLLSHMNNIPLLRGIKDNQENVLDIAIQMNPNMIEPLLLKAVTLSLKDQKELLRKVDTKNKGIYYGGILSYVTHQHPEFIQSMLAACPEERKSEFINQRDSDGGTPLRWAAIRGNVRAVDALYQAGADIHAVDKENKNALYYAVRNGHNEAAKLLLSHMNNIPLLRITKGNQDNVLDIAIRQNPKMIEPLLLKAVTLNLADQKELLCNVEEGKFVNVLAYAVCEHPTLVSKLLGVKPLCDNEEDQRAHDVAVRAHEVLTQVHFHEYFKKINKFSKDRGKSYPQSTKVTKNLVKELKDAKIQLACSTDPNAVSVFKQTCIQKMKNSLSTLDTCPNVSNLIHKFLKVLNKLYVSAQLSVLGFNKLKSDFNKVLSTEQELISNEKSMGKNPQ